jgi:hypothetical protein
MLIWANVHGGFVFGILAWAAYFAGWLLDIWRKSSNWNIGRNLIVVGSTSLIASILTPDLWRNWQGVLANNSFFILSHTSETMPPDFALPGTFPFAFLLLFVLALLLMNWKRMPISHIFLLVGFAIMSLIMARNVPFFSIAAVPILAENIGNIFTNLSIWHKLEEHVTIINEGLKGYVWPVLALLTAIAFFMIYQTKTQSSFNQFSSQNLPVQAAEWLEKHPQTGNMFNDFNWGGYLLFRLWPGTQVFIDSQSDFYGEDLTRQYAEILTGQGNWDVELRQHNVTWLLIPSHSGLAESARISSDWQAAYEDPLAIIFVRK